MFFISFYNYICKIFNKKITKQKICILSFFSNFITCFFSLSISVTYMLSTMKNKSSKNYFLRFPNLSYSKCVFNSMYMQTYLIISLTLLVVLYLIIESVCHNSSQIRTYDDIYNVIEPFQCSECDFILKPKNGLKRFIRMRRYSTTLKSAPASG